MTKKEKLYTVNVLSSDESTVVSIGVDDFTKETIQKAWQSKLDYKNSYIKDSDNENIIKTNVLENEDYDFIKFFDIGTNNVYYYFLTI